MPRAILLLLVSLLLVFPSAAPAAEKALRIMPYSRPDVPGWKAVVAEYGHAPSFLIAVDKKDQRVSVFERKSPLSRVVEYICTTGQNEGDKLVEGDLKTPEGIYFVVRHITSGLDYGLYGYEAYPLNYPNPVDRIRKKTGGGIWIHGKGVPLVPYDSNGCVGMYNQDIAFFRQRPLIGQPVAMAVDVEYAEGESREKADTAALLAAKVEAWARAWSERSAKMFDFYNPALYSIAQRQSFQAFRAQKEHLFKVLPWIKTSVSDIQVLEGPGYWVTWFNQDYKAPNLRSSGTRRLYWQAGEDGEMRIVGMEWLSGFKSPVLYAEAKPASLTDAAPEAEITLAGAAPVAETPAPLAGAAPAPEAASPEAKVAPVEAAPTPVAEAPAVESPLALAEAPAALALREAAPRAQPERDLARADLAAKRLSEGRAFIEVWQKAWKERDLAAYASCYSANAVQGSRSGLREILEQKSALWSAVQVARLNLSDIELSTEGDSLKVVMRQDYADSRGYSDRGVKTLHLEHNNNRSWRIVREDWQPLPAQ